MNYIFLGLSIVSLIVFILLLVTMISFILEGDFEFDLLLSVLTLELMALFAFILCFIAIRKTFFMRKHKLILFKKTKTSRFHINIKLKK